MKEGTISEFLKEQNKKAKLYKVEVDVMARDDIIFVSAISIIEAVELVDKLVLGKTEENKEEKRGNVISVILWKAFPNFISNKGK